MNKTPLILSIVSLVGVVALALAMILGLPGKQKAQPEATEASATKGAIAYFNLDRILEEYDMANDLRTVVESKVQSISEEVNRRGSRLEKDYASLSDKINKGLITRSVAEVQSQKLQEQQNNFNNYATQKQQEIAEEQQVMMNQIADAIKTFIDAYNADKQYSMIFATQGDILPAPMVAGDESLDITEELLEGLNAEYIKTKNAK